MFNRIAGTVFIFCLAPSPVYWFSSPSLSCKFCTWTYRSFPSRQFHQGISAEYFYSPFHGPFYCWSGFVIK